MSYSTKFAAIVLLGLAGAAHAQTDNAPLPLPLSQAAVEPAAALPANTEVLLSMNQEVTTKGRAWNEGDTFNLSVVQDVTYGDYVVIPRGSRAVGKITWLTSKGAFGKSGKMDVELMYVEVNGRRIDLDGTYRQEGEGNTVATVGGVIVAGVFAGFITGKSARIPQGRELMARTASAVPLALPADASRSASAALPVRSAAAPASVEATREAGLAAAAWKNGEGQ
jgi:hypothetical protein